ncbi:MAG: hypothetical protein Q4A13_06110 [Fretibacterium sp.]|nr:hypothetical protein [Fretibacterium sp.]
MSQKISSETTALPVTFSPQPPRWLNEAQGAVSQKISSETTVLPVTFSPQPPRWLNEAQGAISQKISSETTVLPVTFSPQPPRWLNEAQGVITSKWPRRRQKNILSAAKTWSDVPLRTPDGETERSTQLAASCQVR